MERGGVKWRKSMPGAWHLSRGSHPIRSALGAARPEYAIGRGDWWAIRVIVVGDSLAFRGLGSDRIRRAALGVSETGVTAMA